MKNPFLMKECNMKAKTTVFQVLMVLSLSVGFLTSPQYSHAGTPQGSVCFQDNFGDTWFLDFGSYLSGVNFDIHGFRLGTIACNGTFVQPVSGTATLDGNTVVVGVWSIATSPSCVSVSWQAVIDLSTLQSAGWYMTQLGEENSFSLTVVSCVNLLNAARKKSPNLKDPSLR
jgi:hypothetical protein